MVVILVVIVAPRGLVTAVRVVVIVPVGGRNGACYGPAMRRMLQKESVHDFCKVESEAVVGKVPTFAALRSPNCSNGQGAHAKMARANLLT